MRLRYLLLAMTVLVALGACTDGDGGGNVTVSEGDADAARTAWERSIDTYRQDRLVRLQKPDGWLSLVGLHWLEPGSTRIGSGPANGTRISVGPANLGMLTLGRDGSIKLRIDAVRETTVDGAPAKAVVNLIPDSRGTPTKIAFNNGDANFVVIERGGRYALRVRNAMAETRLQFPGLTYYDLDPAFKVRAKFVPHPAGQKVEIVNILGLSEAMDNPGTLSFELQGQHFTIEAIDEGDGRYFIVFADRTSGKESYAAARFVYAEPAGADSTTEIDFNKAYNPPCAFTTYSTCPLPPASNRLNIEIRAGEKKPLKPLKISS